MKIFYAVQATGNGHISRAMELIPVLQKHGTIDIFLSGNNSHLDTQFLVKYKSKGVSLYYTNTGGLDYKKMYREFSYKRIIKEAKALPIEKYDIIINDFESITSLACSIKKIPSIGFGHQASFISKLTPRPSKKKLLGEWVLRRYAPSSAYLGLHFKRYDSFIYNPIIKKDILEANAQNKGHITVYLSQYSDEVVLKGLKNIKNISFEVFSKKAKTAYGQDNIKIFPINSDHFNQSLINCFGLITGAGFEAPAEALYLGKRLLCVPIKGQYEQLCNAEALKSFNIPILDCIDEGFGKKVEQWIEGDDPIRLVLQHSTEDIIEKVLSFAQFVSKDDFQFTPIEKYPYMPTD